MKESTIQMQIVEYLSIISNRFGFVFFSVPNEGALTAAGGKSVHGMIANFKKMGMTPGVSDLIIGHEGKMYCIEVKNETGRQSKVQGYFQAKAEGTRIPYAIARSVDDVVELLKLWGVIK